MLAANVTGLLCFIQLCGLFQVARIALLLLVNCFEWLKRNFFEVRNFVNSNNPQEQFCRDLAFCSNIGWNHKSAACIHA